MSLVWDWWKLFMSLNLKNVVCTISKGIALSHENYRVRHLPAVLLIYMWKGREVCKTEMYSMESGFSSHQWHSEHSLWAQISFQIQRSPSKQNRALSSVGIHTEDLVSWENKWHCPLLCADTTGSGDYSWFPSRRKELFPSACLPEIAVESYLASHARCFSAWLFLTGIC